VVRARVCDLVLVLRACMRFDAGRDFCCVCCWVTMLLPNCVM